MHNLYLEESSVTHSYWIYRFKRQNLQTWVMERDRTAFLTWCIWSKCPGRIAKDLCSSWPRPDPAEASVLQIEKVVPNHPKQITWALWVFRHQAHEWPHEGFLKNGSLKVETIRSHLADVCFIESCGPAALEEALRLDWPLPEVTRGEPWPRTCEHTCTPNMYPYTANQWVKTQGQGAYTHKNTPPHLTLTFYTLKHTHIHCYTTLTIPASSLARTRT